MTRCRDLLICFIIAHVTPFTIKKSNRIFSITLCRVDSLLLVFCYHSNRTYRFPISLPLRLTTFLTTLNHGFVIFCDTLRGFLCKRQMSSIPYKSSISATFRSLSFINHLKNEELEVIALVRRPQDRMIRALCLELYLAETLMCTMRSLPDCFGEKLRIHEM